MVPDMEFQIGYLLLLIDNILSQYEVKDWREDAICGLWKKELLKWVLKKLELILCQNGMKLNKNRNLKWPHYAPSL